MSASTSAESADSGCPLPLGTRYGRRPVHLGAQASRPARSEGNVTDGVVGWPATGQPGRRATSKTLRSWQDRATRQLQSSLRHRPRSRNCVRLCLSATCVDDSEPDPHDAGWRTATGHRPEPPAARRRGANRERLVAASRPDKRREARLTTWASYPPIGLEGWAASDPDSPLTGSEQPFTISPARRTNGRTALTTVAHHFHLSCAI